MTTKKIDRQARGARKARVPEGMAVKRSSAGLGLFATRPYKKGEFIIEYVGRPMSEDEMYTSKSKYIFGLSKKHNIDGPPRINIAGYINHSCRPNAEPFVYRGHVNIKAIKNIKEGDEFTYDYGKEYFDEHIKPFGCRCAKCTAKKKKPTTRRKAR